MRAEYRSTYLVVGGWHVAAESKMCVFETRWGLAFGIEKEPAPLFGRQSVCFGQGFIEGGRIVWKEWKCK